MTTKANSLRRRTVFLFVWCLERREDHPAFLLHCGEGGWLVGTLSPRRKTQCWPSGSRGNSRNGQCGPLGTTRSFCRGQRPHREVPAHRKPPLKTSEVIAIAPRYLHVSVPSLKSYYSPPSSYRALDHPKMSDPPLALHDKMMKMTARKIVHIDMDAFYPSWNSGRIRNSAESPPLSFRSASRLARICVRINLA